LPLNVGWQYGYVESATNCLEQQLQAAIAAKDWSLARRLTTQLETAQAAELIPEADAG
jgi:lysozyme family protein